MPTLSCWRHGCGWRVGAICIPQGVRSRSQWNVFLSLPSTWEKGLDSDLYQNHAAWALTECSTKGQFLRQHLALFRPLCDLRQVSSALCFIPIKGASSGHGQVVENAFYILKWRGKQSEITVQISGLPFLFLTHKSIMWGKWITFPQDTLTSSSQ